MMTNEYVSYKFGTGDPTRLGAQVISGVGFLWGWKQYLLQIKGK